ncbi:protein-tyrosine phosphatase-like protein [Cerioporus squamosus]|nr:protein-tyrosine phosphatase-like protein [Cerioporus squamosus]
MADPSYASDFVPFPSLDPALVKSTLSAPPFVQVEGVFNIRDFGANYPSTTAAARVKPLHLFRSGEPTRITPRGVEQLKALGISKIFDLRADVEIAKYGTATPALDGVDVVRASILEETLDPVGLAAKLKEFAEDEAEAFIGLYTGILKEGGSALEKVLLHLRDSPDAPCLVHCTGPSLSPSQTRNSTDRYPITAGKDRSGLFAAVILKLLGVADDDIASDYALTTIGLQPAFPLLAARFQKDNVFRANWKGTLSLGSARPETMRATLDALVREYGSVEAYVKQHTSLTDADLARIRANLLVP